MCLHPSRTLFWAVQQLASDLGGCWLGLPLLSCVSMLIDVFVAVTHLASLFLFQVMSSSLPCVQTVRTTPWLPCSDPFQLLFRLTTSILLPLSISRTRTLKVASSMFRVLFFCCRMALWWVWLVSHQE